MIRISVLMAMVLLTLAYSCGSKKKVSRVDENKEIDMSGRWNDTDSRLVSAEMVRDAMGRVWISDHQEQHNRKPALIVGIVKNKTSEHISSETFINDIEREFINSGKVKMIQSGAAREELRNERAAQQDFASKETTKKWGLEQGADYMLQGTINSISDSDGKQKLVYYQIDLTIVHLESNEKVWIGTKKIKKVVK